MFKILYSLFGADVVIDIVLYMVLLACIIVRFLVIKKRNALRFIKSMCLIFIAPAIIGCIVLTVCNWFNFELLNATSGKLVLGIILVIFFKVPEVIIGLSLDESSES